MDQTKALVRLRTEEVGLAAVEGHQGVQVSRRAALSERAEGRL